MCPGIDQANWLVAQINGELGRQDYVAYHMFSSRGVSGSLSLAIVTRLEAVEHDGLDYLTEDDTIAHRLRVKLDEKVNLDFYNTNLYYLPGREGAAIRHLEASRLLEWAALHGNNSHQVIVGDFNAVPTGQTIGLMKDTFHSAYEAVNGREAERTWPTPLVFSLDPSEFPVPIPRDAAQPLDYIFVSKGIKVLEARVVFDQPAPSDETLYASDHFGVTSRLSFH